MIGDVLDDPAERSPAELRSAYRRELRSVIDANGLEAVATDAGVDVETLLSLQADEPADVTLEEATAILACGDSNPDADAIVAELRDHLLLGMSTGVLDVDTIAANVDVDLTGQEIQQALEGRTRFTLDQLAEIQSFIEQRT